MPSATTLAREVPGTATVVAAHGRLFYLEAPDGSHRIAVTRGKRNDFTVGDHVIARPASADQHVIESLVPRRNQMLRSDAWRSKRLAANLDQIGIVVSGSPPFSEELLIRVLIAAQTEQIAAAIIANKCDLHEAQARIEPRLRVYEALGYPVLRVAAKTDPAAALACLRPWLRGRTTLLLGQSGMGKSTLINLLVPDADLATQAISDALNTGRHTTTFSRLFRIQAGGDGMPADGDGIRAKGNEDKDGNGNGNGNGNGDRDRDRDRDGIGNVHGQGHGNEDGSRDRSKDGDAAAAGCIIDSPGFQTYGLAHLSRSELMHGMREFAPLLGQCRFHNCTHRDEPGCAIRAAAANGQIDERRLALYQRLIDELLTQG